MPSTRSLKLMESAHRFLQWLTRGRAGWKIGGMPVLELTTVGRRSGERRATMLTSPLREGNAYVVVASRGGDDHHPAWFLNLRDGPYATYAGYQQKTDREIPLVLLEPTSVWR